MAEDDVGIIVASTPMWDPYAEWRISTQVRFAGSVFHMPVFVEMDIVLQMQFERYCKSTWKNHVKVVLNGNAPLHPQHDGHISISMAVSGASNSACYPNDNVRFVDRQTDQVSMIVESVTMPPPPNGWDGVPKEKKLRIAFKTLFIRMVQDGFIMPGDHWTEVKHVVTSNEGLMSIV